MTGYMHGAWIDTEKPLHLIRATGLGENIVRNGDLIAGILDGSIVPAEGPLWTSAEKISHLTNAQRKAIRAAGVTRLVAIDRCEILGTHTHGRA